MEEQTPYPQTPEEEAWINEYNEAFDRDYEENTFWMDGEIPVHIDENSWREIDAAMRRAWPPPTPADQNAVDIAPPVSEDSEPN